MRGLSCLLVLAATSCSDAAPVAPRETKAATGKPASANAGYVAGNTSQELAFLASRVCVPEVTQEREAAAGSLEDVLTKHGYKLVSSSISRQLFGRVVPGFVAAQKENGFGQFMIAFGEGLPACATMLMNHSAIPPVKDLRQAFESQGWEWAHMTAKKPDRLPYAGFKRTDKNGKTILAFVMDNPNSDPTVRLGIDISYTDF
ncbi:MAG TPA: hypothetical protein VF688_03220 [Allosphingosinicella sp.]|jgi:hypothetical protein